MKHPRPLALGAAVILGLSTLLSASPALAQEPPPPEGGAVAAVATAAEGVAEIQRATGSPESALGYGVTTAGAPIVFLNAEYQDDVATAQLDEATEVALIFPAESSAATDVVGGAGYLANRGNNQVSFCSIGFSAWSPTGDPALLTAGHCAADGEVTEVALSKPSTDMAFAGSNDGISSNGTGIAGSFGFAQFGGPGNTPGAQNAPESTDVGVIDVTNDALTLQPAVTDWSTAGEDDLAAGSFPITGVAAPVAGTVSKSGRTSGVTSGSTTVRMPYTDGTVKDTEVLDGYMMVSGRWVHGFVGGALSDPGDSGGAVYQGDQAVGLVSGGPDRVADGDDWVWYTRLVDALQLTGGYTVALSIDAPTVTGAGSAGTVGPGEDVVVAMPANATELVVTRSNSDAETYPVANGEARFPAPEEVGSFQYSLVAASGFSRSAAVDVTIEVALTSAAPVIDAQRLDAAAGARSVVAPLTGTGVAGATVTVTGVPEGAPIEVTVNEDGTWSTAEQTLDIGAHTLSAVQLVADRRPSAAVEGTVTVAPAAPQITSIAPDEQFAANALPTEVAGSGLSGASVELALNGTPVPGTAPRVGDAGGWSTALSLAEEPAEYTVTVTQSLNGVTSRAAELAFTVTAAATPGPSPTPVPELPVTGADTLISLAVGAVLLALAGVGTVAYTTRRTTRLR